MLSAILSIYFSIVATAYGGATPIGGEEPTKAPPVISPVSNKTQSATGNFGQMPMHKMNENCRKDTTYACGECETKLQSDFDKVLADMTGSAAGAGHWGDSPRSEKRQIKSDMTMEQFLEQTAGVMRKNNPSGALNFITIGKSESLHGTSPGNPRIAMKSPDGELWVTFNTDPKAPGYDKVEIMRWNGKKAKYEFEEIVFKPSGGGHVDQNPQNCATCHHTPKRPIWDSYRSWPGIIPPRDDLIETENPGKAPHGGVDASGRAYISFLQRIAQAKMGGTSDPAAGRLKFLDIPVSDQLDASVKSKSPAEQVNAIESFVNEKGWYRVPHVPPRDGGLKNFDMKTAPKAGSAHLAFDQLMGQNMCRVGNELKKHPEFNRLKYGLAYLLHCGSFHPSKASADEIAATMDRLFAANVHVRARNYLRLNRYGEAFQDLPKSFDAKNPYEAFLEDTKNNSKPDNDYKAELHSRYLTEYLESKEGKNRALARDEAFRTNEKKFNANFPYTVIADPGGVRGVDEAAPATIAAFRYLLEPAGVRMGDWSMSRGAAVAGGRSFSYSDQFHVVLMSQPAITDVMEEMKGANLNETCQNLEKKSKQVSLVTPTTLPQREQWGPVEEGQR